MLKKIKTLNLILILVGISALIFTVTMIVLFIKYQEIPDTLCERFYTCVIGECGVTGLIQIAKTIWQKNKKSDDTEIESEENADG